MSIWCGSYCAILYYINKSYKVNNMKVLIVSDSHYVRDGIFSLLNRRHSVKVLTHASYNELYLYNFPRSRPHIIYFHLNSIHQINSLLRNDAQRISVFFSSNFEGLINTLLWPDNHSFIRLDSKVDKLEDFILQQERNIDYLQKTESTIPAKHYVSASELEVITLTSISWSCQKIAMTKNKSYKTVHKQKLSAMRKLGFSNKINFSKYLTKINYHS